MFWRKLFRRDQTPQRIEHKLDKILIYGRMNNMALQELQSTTQTLLDEVKSFTDLVQTVGTAVTDEITRVEAAILALKNHAGIDPKDLDPITAQLQQSVDALRASASALAASTAALNAEQPAASAVPVGTEPAPTPAVDAPSQPGTPASTPDTSGITGTDPAVAVPGTEGANAAPDAGVGGPPPPTA